MSFILLLLASFSFGLVLTSDEYRVLSDGGVLEVRKDGKLVRAETLKPGELLALFRKRGAGRYEVKLYSPRGGFCTLFVSSSCKVLHGGTCGVPKGVLFCPVDPKVERGKVWVSVPEGRSVRTILVHVERTTDSVDVDGDGDKREVVYFGATTEKDIGVEYIVLYDNPSGRMRFEFTRVRMRDGFEITSRVFVRVEESTSSVPLQTLW